MKIAVFGTGGVGAYFGGRLAQAGCEVHFIARGAHLEAIKRDGLIVESIAGDFTLQPALATDNPAEIGPVDLVLVCVKGWQLGAVIESIAPLLHSQTAVLPLLNGVGAVAQLSEHLTRERVLNGLCGIFAKITGPGKVHHLGAAPWLQFGEQDNQESARCRELLAVFERAEGFKASIPSDIGVAAWMKYIFITSTSAVGSITRATFGEVLAQPRTRAVLVSLITEACAVAKAHQIPLAEDAGEKVMQRIEASESGSDTSMQRDMMAGYPSELHSQLGALVEMAEAAGIATPTASTLYACLTPLEHKARNALTV
ncbi:MAG: ketopantoate reductase family protein [Pseudomonadales bacterium]